MKRSLSSVRLFFEPWQIRALSVSTITTSFLFLLVGAVVVSLSEESGDGANGQNWAWVLCMLLLNFGIEFTILKIGAVASENFHKYKTFIYHLTAGLFAFSAIVVRELVSNDATPDYWRQPLSHVRLFIVVLILFYILQGTIGLASLRISQEARQAKDAKAALEVQRGRLIDAQEDTRRQIADFLHDRLQSDLVVLGIQINRATEFLAPEVKQVANAFIDEIERIRQIDVRAASRALAPELDGPGMAPALEDLIAQYQPVISVELEVNKTDNLPKQQRLAAYRIIEQALLNAAKHANPTKIKISIEISAQLVKILVINNGRELQSNLVSGSGFAIIDTWVSQFLGTWSIKQVSGATVLAAEFGVK